MPKETNKRGSRKNTGGHGIREQKLLKEFLLSAHNTQKGAVQKVYTSLGTISRHPEISAKIPQKIKKNSQKILISLDKIKNPIILTKNFFMYQGVKNEK